MNQITGLKPDILGPDYEMTTLPMGTDYEGEVIATLVRRQPDPTANKAVLYIHGYNDYFFQKHVGTFFADLGANFYALDLRKHGRSLLPHQTASLCRTLREYYPEIDAAVEIIKQAGHETVLLSGHSTGGLTACLWAEEGSRRNLVDGLILNSPYLSSGVPRLAQILLDPICRLVTYRQPAKVFPLEFSPHYARSLHRSYQGEWDFDTEWKSVSGTRFMPAWLVSIHEGQRRVRNGLGLRMPVLVMCGTQSGGRRTPPEQMLRADTVLNVNQIAHLSTRLSRNVTCIRVPDAMHDVFLSRPAVREQAFAEISRWLGTWMTKTSAKDCAVAAHL